MIAGLEGLSVSKFIPGVGLVLSTNLSGLSRIPRTQKDHAAGGRRC